MLFDAQSVEEVIDAAARNLVATARDTGVSADVQASVIRTARSLKDDLLQMLLQAQDAFHSERQKLNHDRREMEAAQGKMRAERAHAGEDRKRLDDEMLQQFIVKSDVNIESERRHLLEERCQLEEGRRQLAEERRRMALTDADVGSERIQIAEQARTLALERQYLLQEWRQHWLQLAHANRELAHERSTEQVQAISDERRWLQVEKSRLVDEAHRLALGFRQLDEERLHLEQELMLPTQHGPGFGLDGGPTADTFYAPLWSRPDGGQTLLEPRVQPSGQIRGRLDELHEEVKVLSLMQGREWL